jgi:hypothetical protein
MKESFPGVEQSVFDYVKERIRRLDACFMMAVDDICPTLLSIESGGNVLASVDISMDAEAPPGRLNCQMWLHAPGGRDAVVETNSWDATDMSDATAVELLSREVADWVIQNLQLVLISTR